MEHNYDSAHELLEELESDIANLQDIKSCMDAVYEQIQALCKTFNRDIIIWVLLSIVHMRFVGVYQ